VADHIRNLDHPITVNVYGEMVTFMTVGYVAAALNRTPWTIWEQLDLFPRAAFYLRRDDPRTTNPAPTRAPGAWRSVMSTTAGSLNGM
jgi:hypothetical protein